MHQMGFRRMRLSIYQDAILMVVEEMNLLGAVTKRLYPAIAEKYNTTPAEWKGQSVMPLSWPDQGNVELMNKFLGTQLMWNGKPTNSEFIAMVGTEMRGGNQGELGKLACNY